MHEPIPEQGRWLAQVVRDFFAYHAVPTNFPALSAFHAHVTNLWSVRFGGAASASLPRTSLE